MNAYPIIANKKFQENVIAEVNTALTEGVTAPQLADFLEHNVLRSLRELAAMQLQAALAEQQAEIEAEKKKAQEEAKANAAAEEPAPAVQN